MHFQLNSNIHVESIECECEQVEFTCTIFIYILHISFPEGICGCVNRSCFMKHKINIAFSPHIAFEHPLMTLQYYFNLTFCIN